jgi:hypothetical protein
VANSIGLRWRFEPASGGEFAGPRSQARQGGFGRLYDGWLWIILFVIGLRFAFIALASLTGLRGSYYLKGYLDGLENKKGGLELSVTASVFTLRDAEYLEGYYLGLRTASRASA